MLSEAQIEAYRRMTQEERWREVEALMTFAWRFLKELPDKERERRLAYDREQHHITLRDDQRVRLSIELAEEEDLRSWLDHVQELQDAVVQRRGYLPDSASEIAADRRR